MSYVSIRCRTSAYHVVRPSQHTMSYVSIRCRTSAYDVAYDMQHVGDNMGATWGAGVSQRRACRLFWHGCSRFPKHVVLPFWTSFRVSNRTYSPWQTEHVISAQRARAQAGAHACMSRGRGARRGRMHTCDAVLHRSRKSHHLSHDRVIATNDWSSVSNVEQL